MASESIVSNRNIACQKLVQATGPDGILTVLQRKLLDATSQPKDANSLERSILGGRHNRGLSALYSLGCEMRCLYNIVNENEEEKTIFSALTRMDSVLGRIGGLSVESISQIRDDGSLAHFFLERRLGMKAASSLSDACADFLPLGSQLIAMPVQNSTGYWKIILVPEQQGQKIAEVGIVSYDVKRLGRSEAEECLKPTEKHFVSSWFDDGPDIVSVGKLAVSFFLSGEQVRQTEDGPVTHIDRMFDSAKDLMAFPPIKKPLSYSFYFNAAQGSAGEFVLMQSANVYCGPGELAYQFVMPVGNVRYATIRDSARAPDSEPLGLYVN